MLPVASVETLPNGLRVVLVPDPSAESISLGILVASGSRHEVTRFAGVSHFIEHMLFKGTRTRTALDISHAIEGHGGLFNAFTSEDETCFYATMPCEFLSTAMDILSDMYCHAAIPASEFTRERRVILEELKMYDDEPDSVASENLNRILFPGNALGLPVGGSARTLNLLTPADLRAYINRAYVPSATVVSVAGRFDPADAFALVSRAFGRRRPAKPLPFKRIDFRTRVVPEVRAERDIHQVQLALGYRLPFGGHDPRRYPLSVFDCLMGRTMSSRLFQSVRERRGLSYDIRSSVSLTDETGSWVIGAGLDTKRVPAARAAIRRELDRVCRAKVGAAELRRTKDYLTGAFRLGLEKQQSRMFYFGACVLAYGRIITPAERLAAMEAVSAADVLAVAREVLDPANQAISWVTPKKK